MKEYNYKPLQIPKELWKQVDKIALRKSLKVGCIITTSQLLRQIIEKYVKKNKK